MYIYMGTHRKMSYAYTYISDIEMKHFEISKLFSKLNVYVFTVITFILTINFWTSNLLSLV